jgi:hypothetical protein
VRILVALAVAVLYPAWASSPAEPAAAAVAVSGVKNVVIIDATPSTGSAMCVAALEAKLAERGVTVVESGVAADAEIKMTLAMASWRVWSGWNRPANLTYVVAVKTLPDHQQLFSLDGDDSDDLGEACQSLAKKIVKKLLPPAKKK